jgi:hypothetical protein
MAVSDIGSLAKFGIGPASGSGLATQLLDVDPGESVTAANSWLDGNGIKGTLSRYESRTREGEIAVGGSFTWAPIGAQWAFILPYIFGGSTFDGTAGSTLANTRADFVVQKQMASSGYKVWLYKGLQVNRATIRIIRGQPVKLTIDCIGKSRELKNSYPSINPDQDGIFVFKDATMTIGGTSYDVMDLTIMVDYQLRTRNPMGSRIATSVYPTDRIIAVSHPVPEGDITWTQSTGELTGPFVDTTAQSVCTIAGTGGDSMVITMPAVRYTHVDPTIESREEIMHRMNGQALKKISSSSEELLINMTNV